MTHPAYDHRHVDVRPKPQLVTEDLPLFQHPADHATPAAQTDEAEALLVLAERCANAILDAQGHMHVGEVREALGKLGLLKNDGTEKLDALGKLGQRMGLVAVGIARQSRKLGVSHGNRNTIWARPSTTAQRVAVGNRLLEDIA